MIDHTDKRGVLFPAYRSRMVETVTIHSCRWLGDEDEDEDEEEEVESLAARCTGFLADRVLPWVAIACACWIVVIGFVLAAFGTRLLIQLLFS